MATSDDYAMMGKRAVDTWSRMGKMQGMQGSARAAISAYTPFARAKGEESYRIKTDDLQREFAAAEAEKGRALTREEMAQRMKIFEKQMAEAAESRRQQNLMNMMGVVGLTPEHLEMSGLGERGQTFGRGGRFGYNQFRRDMGRYNLPYIPGQEGQQGSPRFGSMDWQQMTGRRTGAKKWWEVG